MCLDRRAEGKKKVEKDLWKLVYRIPFRYKNNASSRTKGCEGNTNNISKLTNLRGKKARFTDKQANNMTDDVLNLDVVHSRLKISLREMIIGIKSQDKNPSNL